ncbi:hypothetical protein GCM10010169_51330 [Micromonospora fulviviridis]|nr:hypothetical protein GCM10010169_51330 [Micromonospora fulviviridis]
MHVVVTGALVENGAVLLVHRRPTKRAYPDVWDLPGGQVEAGESELQALAREMHEELGVHIVAESASRLGVLHAGSGEDALHVGVWQIGDWVGSPTNRAPDEHDDIAWVGISELGGLPLVHGVLAAMVRSLPEFEWARRHPDVTDGNQDDRGTKADCRACAGTDSSSRWWDQTPTSAVGSQLLPRLGRPLPGEGDPGKDQRDAGRDRGGDGFVEDEPSEDHGDDRQEVGDH